MSDKLIARGYLGDITAMRGKTLKVRATRLQPTVPFDPENPTYDEITVKENLKPQHLSLFAGKRVKITIEETTEDE